MSPRTPTPFSRSSATRRSLSRVARAVGMVTTRNCVRSLSINISFSSIAWSLCRSTARTASSMSSLVSSPLTKLLIPNRLLAAFRAPSTLRLMSSSFLRKLSTKSGKASSRRVCPVGAVSTITRSNSAPLTSCMTLPRATTSSIPGGGLSKMSANSSSPILPARSPKRLFQDVTPRSFSRNSSILLSVSTSIAYKHPLVPSTSLGSPERGMLRASPRECAGSVEMTNVLMP
mmetsp:Transcript_35919/g.88391  ORF Transcript_35919/g.88391 Transcript_35919/m.88391 type:complete len:231 (-) Transcript_35919:53-745(-)